MSERQTYSIGSQPRLIPVVEFEPGSYATQSHPYGDGTSKNDPDGWDQYWRASLADAGIVGLDPIHPGSWDVPLDRLGDSDVLRKLLEVHVGKIQDDEGPLGPEEWLESHEAFSGGFILWEDERELVPPGCCCCLGNLGDWKTAAATENPAWDMLWIGHPWASVRRDGDQLQIRLEPEYSPPPEPSVLLISPAALSQAIRLAEADLESFADRLVPITTEWLQNVGLQATESDAARLAWSLAGLDADAC